MAEKKNPVLRTRRKPAWPGPLHFEVVGGSRPYLWVGQGEKDAEEYLFALSPGDCRKLAAFLNEHFTDAK